jgi:hypothetical protein
MEQRCGDNVSYRKILAVGVVLGQSKKINNLSQALITIRVEQKSRSILTDRRIGMCELRQALTALSGS